MNKQYVIETIVATMAFSILIIGLKIIQGYKLTNAFTSELLHSYESVNVLQTNVSFGTINPSSVWQTIGLILVFAAVYFVIRLIIGKLKPSK